MITLGIAKWYDGSWKCKKELTQRYRDFMRSSPITFSFTHVKGHSDDKFNDYVDKLAKKGVDET